MKRIWRDVVTTFDAAFLAIVLTFFNEEDLK